jgi:hypothetical protein
MSLKMESNPFSVIKFAQLSCLVDDPNEVDFSQLRKKIF